MIPKRLSMKNFLSHDTSVIDFEKFDVALILGTYDDEPDQSNGAGKSAIFEAIAWALFGKSRHKKKNGVVKWDKRACEVEFEFWIDDQLYCIKRSRDKTLDDSDIGFSQWDGTKFNDISCDTNTATDRKIISTINVNHEVFVNSVYFKQNDISMFAEQTPSKRKDVLKSLLRMDKWDKYQGKAKERAKTISAQIKEKQQHVIPVDKIAENIKTCKNDIVSLKKQIKKVNEEYSQLNSALVTKKLDYETTYNSDAAERIKTLQRDFNIAKKRFSEIKRMKAENNKSIEECNAHVSSAQQKISILKDKIASAKKINLSELRSKTIQGQAKERLLKEQIKILEADINLTNECDRCKRPLTKKEISEIKISHKKELADTKQRCKDVKAQLVRAEAKLKSKEQIVADGNKAELDKGKLELKISKARNTINECIQSNERLNIEQKSLKEKNFKEEIAALKAKSGKDGEESAKEKIESLEQNIVGIKRKIDRLNVEYGSKVSHRDELIKTEKEQLKLQKELDKLNREYLVYDKLRNYFGKDGIQSVIIENIIEELENYANATLAKICNEPTSISIQTQRQNDNGSWTETFDISVKEGARTDDFETFSGGEQFRISLALRLAFSNILAKRMGGVLKFLLLDEVSSNLDNKGLDMFIDIIKQLGDDMKVLVITHSERLKERFEDIIMVDKGPTGSQVTMQ